MEPQITMESRGFQPESGLDTYLNMLQNKTSQEVGQEIQIKTDNINKAIFAFSPI